MFDDRQDLTRAARGTLSQQSPCWGASALAQDTQLTVQKTSQAAPISGHIFQLLQ
jgi:hypothetical protein